MATDLESKIKQLEARLKEAKALKARKEQMARHQAAKKARADDTRKKILAGSIFLERLPELSEGAKQDWARLLNKKLVRDNDRALFGLPPLKPIKTHKQLLLEAPKDNALGMGEAHDKLTPDSAAPAQKEQ